MSGKKDVRAQLALMDAIVFFLAAMAVSTLLFSTLQETVDGFDQGAGSWFDSQGALASLLGCSLGSEVTVTVHGSPLLLPERTEVSECLLLEAHVIAEGDGGFDFTALDRVMLDIVEDLCRPPLEGRLVLYDVTNGTPVELHALPHEWPAHSVVDSASSELADSEGRFLVQLLSAPASGLEAP